MIIKKKAYHFPKKQGPRCAVITAWKVSVFGAILVRIFPYSDWIRTWIIPNMDNFYAAYTEVVFLQSCLQLNIKVFCATAEVEKKNSVDISLCVAIARIRSHVFQQTVTFITFHIICDALRDLVPFVQFKKTWKSPKAGW